MFIYSALEAGAAHLLFRTRLDRSNHSDHESAWCELLYPRAAISEAISEAIYKVILVGVSSVVECFCILNM